MQQRDTSAGAEARGPVGSLMCPLLKKKDLVFHSENRLFLVRETKTFPLYL